MHAAARTSSQPWAIGHDTRVLRFSDTREHAADKSCLHDETSRPETLSVSACWVRTASNDRDLPTRAFRSYFICTRALWDHLACGSLGQVQRHLTVAFSNSAKSISTCRSIVCVRRRTVFCKGQSHSGLAPESCSRCFASILERNAGTSRQHCLARSQPRRRVTSTRQPPGRRVLGRTVNSHATAVAQSIAASCSYVIQCSHLRVANKFDSDEHEVAATSKQTSAEWNIATRNS